MKTLFYTLFLCIMALPTWAKMLPYTEAIKKAKEENKYMVVFWNGSDWSPEARDMAQKFEEFTTTQDLPVIWCEWDEREKMTEDEEKTDFFTKNRPPTRIWSIPAISILSPSNQPAFKHDKLKAEHFASLIRNVPRIIENQNRVEAFWKQAEEKEKVKESHEAVVLYGKGLDLVPENLIPDYKNLVNKVKKLDPEDKEGVVLRNNFRHGDIYEHIEKMIKEKKDYEGAIQFVDQKLSVKDLSKEQQQKLIAAKFFIANKKGDSEEMLTRLQEIIKLDPKTDMGRGAAYYYEFLTKPVIMNGNKFGYEEHRPQFLPMVMDASPYIKSPGKYKISCVFYKDKCDFRNARLMSGKRVIAALPKEMKDKNASEFILDVPSAPSKLQLVVEIKGRGWYKARGEINITPVK